MEFTESFEFAGHSFTAKIAELPVTTEMDLQNIISSSGSIGVTATGTAKILILREGVTQLYKDLKPVNLRNRQGGMYIPPLRDRETHESLIEPLLRAVVAHNDWLGYLEPFNRLFEGYLPSDAEEEDPTLPEPSSPAGSSFTQEAPRTLHSHPSASGSTNAS